MRYKVTLQYDGNNYEGFQSQSHGRTVQDTIEKAIKQIFKKDIRIIMASRTDAKVHALCQVIHFDDEKVIDDYRLKGGLNSFLPSDIHVTKVEKVSEKFHARFSVKSKTYEYLINNGEYNVFLDGYAYQSYYKLDLDLMRKGAELFLGTHDFTSFNTTPKSVKENQIRTITEFKITNKKDLVKIRVTGDGFLKNMVRIMVGSLLDLSRGKKTLKEIQDMLDNPTKSTRRYNITGEGLYLVKIRY